MDNFKLKLPNEDTVFRRQKNVLDWGQKEFDIMDPFISNYRTCLDIGAHVGITSLRFSKHFQSVYSFEPVHYSFLIENTSHLNNVFCYDYAVSDYNGEIEIYPGTANSGVGIIPYEHNKEFIKKRFELPKSRYKSVEKITVKCMSIDELSLTTVDMIKIDVEGYNMPVLNGMIETLKENSPIIQLEMAFEQNVNQESTRLLSSLGYKEFNKYERDIFYQKT